MTERRKLPTVEEVAIGAYLHDIGKFMQRAIGDVNALPETVRNRISDVLPSFNGRPSHFHALFSDAFFDECVDPNPLPPELDPRWVRDCAVYHHRPLNDGVAVPNGAITHLVTEADRVAAAIERYKKSDAEQEASPEPRVRDQYRRTRLVATPSDVWLDRKARAERAFYPIAEISSQALLDLQTEGLGKEAPEQYGDAWKAFKGAYAELAGRAAHSLDGYVEGLIALGERFCWCVPSSTIDDPDVSLHDHARVTAAVAACLFRHHEFVGDVTGETAVRDRARGKFRLLAGDLSGIQATLFRLHSENVKGLARLLRGRSFRMQLIGEVAARRSCQAFGVPLFSVIQSAGGRFLLLVAETAPEAAERRVAELRGEIDAWMRDQYVGDLALNLALTEPLSAGDLIERLPTVYQGLRQVVDTAKLHPLRTQPTGVVTLPFNAALGICGACGVRPATTDGGDGPRCPACAAETRMGRDLVRSDAVAISAGTGGADDILGRDVRVLRADQAGQAPTGFRRRPSPVSNGRPAADRFFEAYTPRHTRETLDDGRLAAEREETAHEGDLITFAELAACSTELVAGQFVGRKMLALLKADVDNLGLVFSRGLRDAQGKQPRASLSRTAALSRLMDAFFTGWLPDHLRQEFPRLYTVYAGGDDMMVLGPWLDVLRFAPSLRRAFGRFSGNNPSLTLSAGIELFGARTPISLTAAAAERRLEIAKHGHPGKDRIAAIVDEPLTWADWDEALDQAEELNDLVRDGSVSSALLYRLLALDDRRRKAATDPACADWRAKLGYSVYRSVEKNANARNETVRERLFRLMGVDDQLADSRAQSHARLAITIALYRNR